MVPQDSTLFLTGPRSLLRKVRYIAEELVKRISLDLNDVFKFNDRELMINEFYTVLRKLIPQYIFFGKKDDASIHLAYSLFHSKQFVYDIRTKIVLGGTELTTSVEKAIYLSVDIASLVELILVALRKNMISESMVYGAKLCSDLSKIIIGNQHLVERIMNACNSQGNYSEIIKILLSKTNPVVTGEITLDISSLFDKPKSLAVL